MSCSFGRVRWPAAIAATLAILAGAATGGEAVAKSCSDLNGAAVGARAIGLPTTGAAVSSAVPVRGSADVGAYCLVSGDIKPVDPAAPNIKFQLALPEVWNGKAVMLGGAGFDGKIPPVTNPSNLWGAQKAPLPLARGYAAFSSDSGHQTQTGTAPGAFAANVEALRNYAGDALKKTRDVAVALITSRYGHGPAKSYFIGFSKGGGEALTIVERWPADWDGVVAGGPGWNVTSVSLNMLNASQAFAAPGAWLNEAKRHLLYNAALDACDALDGVKDGVISNVRACAIEFDPATATYSGKPLRCPGGADTGDTCLSDAQLSALKRVNEPKSLSFPLGSGETSLPGYPIYIADNGGGVANAPLKMMVTAIGAVGLIPPVFPVAAGMSADWSQSDGFIRYVVVGDSNFNSLKMSLSTADGLAERFGVVSALDANISDISPFMNRGGKLLLWTGTADMSISPRATEYFYWRVQSAIGPAKVDTFLRFYEVPGAQHGPSTVFDAQWDQLAAIENWVEKGVDPSNNLVVSDDAGVPGRTRPMCMFPTWPKYKGSGDVNRAESFICSSF